MRIAWAIAALVASAGAQALQTVEVANGATVTVQVSARELTRVSMSGERRIVRVWGLSEQMTVEPDAEGGQVFIRPVEAHQARPFSFFVKDEAGDTYTLIAVPVDMPADAIVLSPKASGRINSGRPRAYVMELKSLVRAMANGRIPDGYTAIEKHEPVPLWAEASIVLLKRYEGDFSGEVYRLTNVSGVEMRLEERELGSLSPNIKAVAIERHALRPGESTDFYLVRGEP